MIETNIVIQIINIQIIITKKCLQIYIDSSSPLFLRDLLLYIILTQDKSLHWVNDSEQKSVN